MVLGVPHEGEREAQEGRVRWKKRTREPGWGDRRVRSGFLLWPREINGESRWLEWAEWVESYDYIWIGSGNRLKWRTVRWTDGAR